VLDRLQVRAGHERRAPEASLSLAGFRRQKEQLHLTVSDDRLTVRGESRKESEEKRKNYYRQEIRYGAFQRSIPLPVEVDAAKTHAELKNGMLEIALPKSKQPKAREIKVAVA
jgi:HSP20 family protein